MNHKERNNDYQYMLTHRLIHDTIHHYTPVQDTCSCTTCSAVIVAHLVRSKETLSGQTGGGPTGDVPVVVLLAAVGGGGVGRVDGGHEVIR